MNTVIVIAIVVIILIVVLISQSPKKDKQSVVVDSNEKPEPDDIEPQTSNSDESDIDYLNSFVVIDTETTGLSEGYQVIEIAVVDMDENILLSERAKPSIAIEQSATKVHGIVDSELSNAESFNSLTEKLLLAIQGRRIAGYNLQYDTEAIYNSAIASHANVKLDNEAVCVMEYANTVFKLTKSMKLTELCEAFSISTYNAHSATYDALMTVKLLKKLFKIENTFGSNYLPEFEEINPLNLSTCKDGDSLTEWTASDGRVMLFSPSSIGGSGRVAYLSETSKKKVIEIYESDGSVEYIVSYENNIPTIEIKTYSKEDVENSENKNQQKYIDSLRTELPVAGVVPRKGSLRLTLKNIILLEPYITQSFGVHEQLHIKHQSLDSFLGGSLLLDFYDESGKLVAQQHLSKPWIRVVGVITSGYKATVQIVNATEKNNTKVDVIFDNA
ncbi:MULTISPECIES: 3'-5' exonuclease [Colwellia]|uniref:DNA polymerase III subunit epsilon n=1 Tax=Colwellia marinimaniae TaxID=1513592 RepID=A0ABQ0MU44_9GAMM|nr:MULTISPECIES: 3'-5' exonuclease [Colwellia]GAW95898.1 DNA polymerase III subunit epsilon [Colwellia marinimaniae]